MARKPLGFYSKSWSLIQWTATAGVWLIIFSIGAAVWYAKDLPNIEKALSVTRQPTVTLLGSDGSHLATRGDLYGTPLRVGDLPVSLQQAVLATEDRRFYNHFGLDLIGIGRAAYRNLMAGRIVQGGSTITQQVAKNLFLNPERSFKRKIQEVMLSFWLEHKFSKNQIFTIYLNRAYLGSGTYGVDAAARRYFGIPATRLTVYESAMIAGLLKAPSRYNPRTNPELARERAIQVLNNMVAAGYLAQNQATRMVKRHRVQHTQVGSSGRYFIDWAIEQVSAYLAVGNRDIIVKTTLNPNLQREAEGNLAKLLDGPGKKAAVSQGALVALANDGAVRAMVGGRNYTESPFNRATQARRQPGSAFKPFVFLTALEKGMLPSDLVKDAPIKIGDWVPRNFKRRYQGQVTMSDALAYSLNTAAVRIGQRVGINNIVGTAGRLGILGDIKPTPSLALGTHEVSLVNLTAAYAPFANGGMGVWPYGIKEIRNGDGEVLYTRVGSGLGRVAQVADIAAMNRMMANAVVIGTGKAASLDRPAAGKTGTSQNYRDAWFVGYTTDLIAGVWLGNDNGAPMKGVTGGGLPAILWKRFMTHAHNGAKKRSLLGVIGLGSNRAPKIASPKYNESPKILDKRFWVRVLSSVRGNN